MLGTVLHVSLSKDPKIQAIACHPSLEGQRERPLWQCTNVRKPPWALSQTRGGQGTIGKLLISTASTINRLVEGIIIKRKHASLQTSCFLSCLVNKEAIWVCQVKITITQCHGKSLKATYEPNKRQHVTAFRAQLLLLPCLCAALGDLGYSEQGHRKTVLRRNY